MIEFLICLMTFAALWVVAWPVALVMLLAAPLVALICLGLKLFGFVVGSVLHFVLWVLAVLFAIALGVTCLPLVLIF